MHLRDVRMMLHCATLPSVRPPQPANGLCVLWWLAEEDEDELKDLDDIDQDSLDSDAEEALEALEDAVDDLDSDYVDDAVCPCPLSMHSEVLVCDHRRGATLQPAAQSGTHTAVAGSWCRRFSRF
eukprot:128864-Pyramimonas_sp.AAC.2